MILSPGSFRNDPYGHVTNQAGHFAIGLGLTTLLFPLWGIPAALVVGLLYGLLWEGLVQRWVLPVDSFEDTVHVTTGGGFVASALTYDWPGAVAVLAAWAGLLAVGVWRRM
jgi:hypothetical protein